jgi:hypothetical protein
MNAVIKRKVKNYINIILDLLKPTTRKIPTFLVESLYLILWRLSFLFGYIKYLISHRGEPKVKSCGTLKISSQDYLHSTSNIANSIQASMKQIKLDYYDKLKSDKKEYVMSTFDYLPEEVYPDILKILCCSEIMNLAERYLKTQPVLGDIMVYTNFPRSDLLVEGSKMWHRDTSVYHKFEVYINLSDININSGPFYTCKSENTSRFTVPYFTGLGWHGMRFNDSDLSKYCGEDVNLRLTSNIGGVGTCVYLDSGFNYHKGGHTTQGTRTVMRITYQATIHSSGLGFNFNDSFKNFLLKSQNNSKKSFSKYSNLSKTLKRIKYAHLSSQNSMIFAYMKMNIFFHRFIHESMTLFKKEK